MFRNHIAFAKGDDIEAMVLVGSVRSDGLACIHYDFRHGDDFQFGMVDGRPGEDV